MQEVLTFLKKLLTTSSLEKASKQPRIPSEKRIPEEFEFLLPLIEKRLGTDSTGHDKDHVIRVLKIALKIQAKEGGDRLVIGIASLLHDLLRPWEKEQKDRGIDANNIKTHFSLEAIEIIRDELETLNANISQQQVDQILEVIALHEDYELDKSKKSIELRVVQDADWLDAIGVIGIIRTAMFGGSHKDKMFVYDEELPHGGFRESQTTKGGSILRHIYEKLLTLKDMMNTETGLEMAIPRHISMQILLRLFYLELELTDS